MNKGFMIFVAAAGATGAFAMAGASNASADTLSYVAVAVFPGPDADVHVVVGPNAGYYDAARLS